MQKFYTSYFNVLTFKNKIFIYWYIKHLLLTNKKQVFPFRKLLHKHLKKIIDLIKTYRAKTSLIKTNHLQSKLFLL